MQQQYFSANSNTIFAQPVNDSKANGRNGTERNTDGLVYSSTVWFRHSGIYNEKKQNANNSGCNVE